MMKKTMRLRRLPAKIKDLDGLGDSEEGSSDDEEDVEATRHSPETPTFIQKQVR